MKQEERHDISNNSHLEKVEEMIKSIKYGSVTITVQDGKIVQIDKVEKYRVKT